jgi:hypothetical protein
MLITFRLIIVILIILICFHKRKIRKENFPSPQYSMLAMTEELDCDSLTLLSACWGIGITADWDIGMLGDSDNWMINERVSISKVK